MRTGMVRGRALGAWVACVLMGVPARAATGPHSGDVDASGDVNVADVGCLVAATLSEAQGAPPPPCMGQTPEDADLDCDGGLTVTDVQRVILLRLEALHPDPAIEALLAAGDADGSGVHDACEGPCGGVACPDDGDPCTEDACVAGVCVGVPIVGCCADDEGCAPAGPCVVAWCDAGECAAEPVPGCCVSDADCDDHNACTEDGCSDGECGVAQIPGCCLGAATCDDGDPCTTDDCVDLACTHDPVPCDDGDPCTADGCEGGECGSAPLPCDDGDPCTVDACAGGDCAHVAILCADGDPCTADACAGGDCAHTPLPGCPGDAAVVHVTAHVVAPAPERFGANLTEGWLLGNWTLNPAMEPLVRRWRFYATEGGADWFRADDMTWYHTWTDGFWDGAVARIYRLQADGRPALVRTSGVASWLAANRRLVTPAQDTLAAGPAWVDAAAPNGATWWYEVTAVDAAANESAPASIAATPGPGLGAPPPAAPAVTVTWAPGETQAPAAVTGLSAQAHDGAVSLAWTPSPSPDVVGYVVRRWERAPEERERALLTDAGEPVQPGDIVFLDLVTLDVDRAAVYDRGIDGAPPLAARGSWIWQPNAGASVAFRPHDDASVEDGGVSYLRVSATGAGTAEIGQYRFDSPDSTYPQLTPGAPIRLSVWLRQQGVPTSQVRVRLTGPYQGVLDETLQVGGEWARFDLDFEGPPPPPPGPASRIVLSFEGGGHVDVDNLVLSEVGPGRAPFDLAPDAVAWLDAFRPGVVRLWGGQTNLGGGVTLDSWTAPARLAQRMWDVNQGPQPGPSPGLGEGLALCEAVGADPWLIVSPLLDEAEWQGLVEYLAAPWDPLVDTPETKPWAWRRVQARGGDPTPWTEDLGRILLEYGNETWSTGFFAPQAFPGLPDGPGGAEMTGLFAAHFFEAARQSPWWTPEVEERVAFVVNGWFVTPDFGATVAAQVPGVHWVDVTAYSGGWEAGFSVGGDTVSDDGFRDALLYAPRVYHRALEPHVARREAEAAWGLAVYEGGPGYSLPDGGTPFRPTEEAYGKSLASGVTTLDDFLYGSLRGLGPQAFFSFAPGRNWSSHAPLGLGGLAQPPWQALALRNRHASGDMVLTATMAAPAVDLPEAGIVAALDDVPLVQPYAFRDGGRWTVLLLSRALDEAIPVLLRLPFASATVTRHALVGDPRTSNTDGPAVTELETALGALDLSDGLAVTLPPGTVHAYVFEGAGEPAASAPQPLVAPLPGQEDPTTAPVARFRVFFGQPVTGFEAADLVLGGTAAPAQATVEEVPGTLGSTYTATVTGMPGSGTVTLALPAGAAVGLDGAPTLASGTASVTYEVPPPQDRLVAWDDLNVPPSAAPFPPHLAQVATGEGFGPWAVQNFAPPGPGEGFLVGDASPLAVGELATAGGYATGGLAYTSAGRGLDVAGAFAQWRVYGSTPPVVGQPGTTLWWSVLLRKDTDDAQPLYASLVDAVYAQQIAAIRVAVGFFGAPSVVAGERRWTLRVRAPADDGFVDVPTQAPVVVGQPVLLVARLGFGVGDVVDLWVDPPPGDPGPPQASVAMPADGVDLVFRTLGLYPGNDPGRGSADELRFGDSYAAVTPRMSQVAHVEQAPGQADPTAEPSVRFAVQFGGPVVGLEPGAVVVGGTAGVTGAMGAAVTELAPDRYEVAVTGMTDDGTVTLRLPQGAAMTDPGGLPTLPGTSVDATVTWRRPPAVALAPAPGQADPTGGPEIAFVATFSQAVDGVDPGAVVLGGAAGPTEVVVAEAAPWDGTTWTLLVSGMSHPGPVSVALEAGAGHNALGDASAASEPAEVWFSAPPAVTVAPAPDQAAPATGAPVRFVATFEVPVTGLEAADVLVSGSAGALLAAVSPLPPSQVAWEVAVLDPRAAGDVTVALPAGAAQDVLGAPSLPSAPASVPFDPVGWPTATVEQAPDQADPADGAPVRFVVAFSAPVAGLEPADLVVGGTAFPTTVTLTELPPLDGTAWEAAVSGMTAPGTVTLSLPALAVQDAEGRPNLAATSVDAAVTFVLDLPPATLLAHDGLAGQAPTPPWLAGVGGGTGFATPWLVQNFALPDHPVAWRVEGDAPLAFGPLVAAPPYARGGDAYQSASRVLDVAGAFAAWQVPGSAPARIGAPGTTLYVSALVRRDQAATTDMHLSLVSGPYAWSFAEHVVEVGLFDGASVVGGAQHWTVRARDGAGWAASPLAPAAVGVASLVVLRLDFGATTTIAAWADPASLGGLAPPPDAVLEVPAFSIQSVGLYGGGAEERASFDELRLGDTWGAVTPTVP